VIASGFNFLALAFGALRGRCPVWQTSQMDCLTIATKFCNAAEHQWPGCQESL